jgi:hypothetical protein
MPSPQRVKTVTTTATQIVATDPTHRPIWLQIDGNTVVYVGDSTVTVANGFPVAKHAAPIQGTLGPGQDLWAIVASGTETIRIFSTPED